ncbi:MAG: hypothetical protein DMG53_08085 [Acidobacteria bacterium]|nr:MAG: hypothetical protein DMG53_08085 [Acidobacteriota bacterium]
MKTKWQVSGTFAIGQEAEVPDAHEPFGEQMQQEAATSALSRNTRKSGVLPNRSSALLKRSAPSE